MADKLRVHTLSKELGVTSKAILQKCKLEGVEGITNHMSTVSAGLAETIREWFSAQAQGTAVETAAKVDLEKVRAKRKTTRKHKTKEKQKKEAKPDKAEKPVEAQATPEAPPAPRPEKKKGSATKAPPKTPSEPAGPAEEVAAELPPSVATEAPAAGSVSYTHLTLPTN